MGRSEWHEADATTFTRRVYLTRVRINDGGYDDGGAYWGAGAPLYKAASWNGAVTMYLRADSRDGAKAHVQKRYPAARFFR